MKVRRLFFALVLVLLTLGVSSPLAAHATPPERRFLQLAQITPDETLSSLCGFPVTRYTNVAATVDTYRDQQGGARRALIHQDGILELRANGRAAEGFSQVVENVRFSEGVSGNVVLEEEITWIVRLSHGPGVRGTGSLRAEFNDQGDIVLFRNTGPALSDPSICAALAP
jgi:hypothetical protein